MLQKVILENFQAHEHSEIEFSEGINVISGASDQGKSSVIRAIRWVLENRPSGFAFKREGAEGPTRVTLIFDTGKIVKTRSETENSYKVYKAGSKKCLEFKALRSDVPEEVREISQFGPYNIQYQFGTSFLLDDSPGEVAKRINSLSGVTIIDDILKETNSRIRAEKAKETATKDLLADLKKTKAGFKNLKRLEKIVAEMEASYTEAEEFRKYRNVLDGYVTNLKRIESTPVIDIHKAEEYVKELQEMSAEYKDYSEARSSLKGNIASLLRIQKQLGKHKNIDKASTLIDDARMALPKLVEAKTLRAQLKSHLEKLRSCELGYKAATKAFNEAESAISQFKKENKVCPVCSKKW